MYRMFRPLKYGAYYPFGMLMPGRIYPTPQNEHLQPASGAGTAASPITVYQHAFSTAASGSTTYSVAPDVINGNLSSSSWTSSAGNFTSYPGATGNALSLSSASAATTTYTLVFNVSADKTFTATSFSLWRMSSGTGYRNWSLTINNIFVGSDTITTTGTTTGTVNVSNPVSNLTGTVTVVLALSGGSHGGSGTFRLDNFTLNGYLQLLPGTATSSTNTNDKAKYPYTINGQMRSDEIAVNTTTAVYWEYDSRIMRRWNVDPKGTSAISPYNCFNGNPVWMTDPLGDKVDSTGYYSNSGELLLQTTGKGYNHAVVVNDKDASLIKALAKNKTVQDNANNDAYQNALDKVIATKNVGITYDLNAIRKFLKDNSNRKAKYMDGVAEYDDKRTLASFGTLTVKGRKINGIRAETLGNIVLKNGVVTVGNPDNFYSKNYAASTPMMVPYENNKVGTVHTHPFGGVIVVVKWRNNDGNGFFRFYPGPSDTDGDKSLGNSPAPGYRNALIDDKNIILYDNDHKDITIPLK